MPQRDYGMDLAAINIQVFISSTFYTGFLADILAPKNFKPKTQLCYFWHQNISPKHSFVIFGTKISAQNVRVKC